MFSNCIYYILISLWRVIGWVLAPFLKRKLSHSLLMKGSDPLRIDERYGLPSSSLNFPSSAHILWLHAASVGETWAVFPLIDNLLSHDGQLHILLTTTTTTGAETCARHPSFGTRLHHQFAPYDIPQWTKKFLNSWQPKAAIFVESELWPGFIASCNQRHIPIILVNARLSDRSFRRWNYVRPIFKHIFRKITWISPRSDQDQTRLQQLGLSRFTFIGDLKEEAPPLPTSSSEESRLRTLIKNRLIFVAASTHDGEEDIIAEAAYAASLTHSNLLVIIVPRHPKRGISLAQHLHAPARSLGEHPTEVDLFWIADTLGELGLFYRLADCVFIGNSLCAPGGGHNPFEPIQLSCPTATGPYMQNWRQACHTLAPYLSTISDASSLKEWLVAEKSIPSYWHPINNVSQQLSIRIIDTITYNTASL